MRNRRHVHVISFESHLLRALNDVIEKRDLLYLQTSKLLEVAESFTTNLWLSQQTLSDKLSTMSTLGSLRRLRMLEEKRRIFENVTEKHVNFSQPLTLKEKSKVSYHQVEGLKSSHGFPSTPTGSRVILLHSLASGSRRDRREFPKNFQAASSRLLAKEKQISKRSARKKWLHQPANVVRNEKSHLDEQFCAGRRHDLCCRELFECSPNTGKIYIDSL